LSVAIESRIPVRDQEVVCETRRILAGQELLEDELLDHSLHLRIHALLLV
jgi:hypothetical protein